MRFGLIIGLSINVLANAETMGSSVQVSQKKIKVSKKLKWEWKLGVGGHHTQSGFDEATWADIQFKNKAKYKLIPNLNFISQFKVQGQSSQVQRRFSDSESKPVSFQEFVVEYKPLNSLSLQGGAISQSYFSNDIFMSKDISFPGIKESLNFNGHLFDFEISAQQSVPTSDSFSTNLSEKERTPSFFAENAQLTYKPTKKISFNSQVGHYSYNNLPSIVAEESAKLGNTVKGTTAPAAEFRDEFNGGMAGLSFRWLGKNLGLNLGSQFIQNFKAPEKSNRGQRTYINSSFGSRNIKIKPQMEYFFAESDVVPAYYNTSSLGNTNRTGVKYELKFTFEKLGFEITTAYLDSRLINDYSGSPQSDLKSFAIGVETLYVEF